ncbi:MAG: hypothetical protein PHX62_01990 [Bacilli bacterium]|nr:hypothetical protein [Bacilli bacterium]
MAFEPTRFYRFIKDAKTVDEVYEIIEKFNLKSEQEHRIVQMYKTSKWVQEREQKKLALNN